MAHTNAYGRGGAPRQGRSSSWRRPSCRLQGLERREHSTLIFQYINIYIYIYIFRNGGQLLSSEIDCLNINYMWRYFWRYFIFGVKIQSHAYILYVVYRSLKQPGIHVVRTRLRLDHRSRLPLDLQQGALSGEKIYEY